MFIIFRILEEWNGICKIILKKELTLMSTSFGCWTGKGVSMSSITSMSPCWGTTTALIVFGNAIFLFLLVVVVLVLVEILRTFVGVYQSDKGEEEATVEKEDKPSM